MVALLLKLAMLLLMAIDSVVRFVEIELNKFDFDCKIKFLMDLNDIHLRRPKSRLPCHKMIDAIGLLEWNPSSIPVVDPDSNGLARER